MMENRGAASGAWVLRTPYAIHYTAGTPAASIHPAQFIKSNVAKGHEALEEELRDILKARN